MYREGGQGRALQGAGSSWGRNAANLSTGLRSHLITLHAGVPGDLWSASPPLSIAFLLYKRPAYIHSPNRFSSRRLQAYLSSPRLSKSLVKGSPGPALGSPRIGAMSGSQLLPMPSTEPGAQMLHLNASRNRLLTRKELGPWRPYTWKGSEEWRSACRLPANPSSTGASRVTLRKSPKLFPHLENGDSSIYLLEWW